MGDENKHDISVTPGFSPESTAPTHPSTTRNPHRRRLTLKNALTLASASAPPSARPSAAWDPHRRRLTLKNALTLAPAPAPTSKPSIITYSAQISGDIIKVQGKTAHRIKIVPDKDNRYNITVLIKPIVTISTDSKTYSLKNNSTLFLTKKGILGKIREFRNMLLNYSISPNDVYGLSIDDISKFKELTETETIRGHVRFKYNILKIFNINNYTFVNKNGPYTHVDIINSIIVVDTYLQQLYNLIETKYDENDVLFDNFNKLYTELTKNITQLARLLQYKLIGIIDNIGKVSNESSKINNNTIERIIYTQLSNSISKIKDNNIEQSIIKTNELGIYGETK